MMWPFPKAKKTMRIEVKRLFFTTSKQYQKLLLGCIDFTKDESAYLRHRIQDGTCAFQLYVTGRELTKIRKLGRKRKVACVEHYSWNDMPSGVKKRGLH